MVVCASMGESLPLSPFFPPLHEVGLPRGKNWSERTRRQTELAGIRCDHVSLVCLSLLPFSPPFVYPHEDSDGLCFMGGRVEWAGPHQKLVFSLKWKKGQDVQLLWARKEKNPKKTSSVSES